MKKITVAVIALIFVFFAASLGFAANEFQIMGTVTKIKGDQITIKDDKGKEITVEARVSDIKVGEPIILKGQVFKSGTTRTRLTAGDIEFLIKQCLIDRADADVIPKLEEQTRMNLFSWIEKKDCKLFSAFKVSRAYYRQLKPKTRISLPPAGWDSVFLTDDEFKQYSEIIASAPW